MYNYILPKDENNTLPILSSLFINSISQLKWRAKPKSLSNNHILMNWEKIFSWYSQLPKWYSTQSLWKKIYSRFSFLRKINYDWGFLIEKFLFLTVSSYNNGHKFTLKSLSLICYLRCIRLCTYQFFLFANQVSCVHFSNELLHPRRDPCSLFLVEQHNFLCAPPQIFFFILKKQY